MTTQAGPRWAPPGFQGLIGVAGTDITPPADVHIRNWGAAPSRQATGVAGALRAVVMTFRAHATDLPLVLVGVDLGWWMDPEDEAAVRETLCAALGLPDEQLVVALSHTHAGPSLRRADVHEPGGGELPAYLDGVTGRLIAAARSALASEDRGILDWEYGRCGLARNRDLPEPGGARIVCGFNPEAPADDTLLVGRICTAAGKARGVIVNYACHPTTLGWENTRISPDYVGPMRELVEPVAGPCLFLQGASGELAPRRQYTDDQDVVARNGRQLGFAVLSVLCGMIDPGTELRYQGVVESGAPLGIWTQQPSTAPKGPVAAVRRVVELPRSPARDRAPRADASPTAAAIRQERASRIGRAAGTDASVHFPVICWRLGGMVLVAHPGEAYSQLQVALRAAFPDLVVVVINLASGAHLGYLPPAALYATDVYQVWQTPLGPGSLEILVDTCRGTLADLTGVPRSGS